MYKLDIVEGRREWLLASLFQARPLFHAALALSSYHRQPVLNTEAGETGPTRRSMHHEEHLAKSLTEFHKAVKMVSQFVLVHMSKIELATYMSMMQLIYFEVCATCHISFLNLI